MTMTLLETVTLGSGGAASITFSDIPQEGYTDLLVVLSGRTSLNASSSGFQISINFNGTTSNLSSRILFGNGSGTGSLTDSAPFAYQNANDDTSNTFGNGAFYIPNYRSAVAKSFSIDSVYENNSTTARQNIGAGLWNDTAAITSVRLYPKSGGNLVEFTSASLYGITAGSSGGVTVS